jgi:DDE superfamily endonuclease
VENTPAGTFSVILTHTSPGYSGLLILIDSTSAPSMNFFQQNGPFEAGTYNDMTIFEKEGLAEKLHCTSTGKKCIADSGYCGAPHLVRTPNNRFDHHDVRKFKSRATLHHERFNAMLKTFHSIGDGTFCHSKKRLQQCVEAIAVLVQYKMEFGEPLFDI